MLPLAFVRSGASVSERRSMYVVVIVLGMYPFVPRPHVPKSALSGTMGTMENMTSRMELASAEEVVSMNSTLDGLSFTVIHKT